MPLAAAALSAARRGASTITALLEAVLLDPSLDWIAANRAAAAHRQLDSAMALNLWSAHLQVRCLFPFSVFVCNIHLFLFEFRFSGVGRSLCCSNACSTSDGPHVRPWCVVASFICTDAMTFRMLSMHGLKRQSGSAGAGAIEAGASY